MCKRMNQWKRIRLELSRTRDFPAGSVSRGYLIQLPLDQDDRIDDRALAQRPQRATVRRYWSTEPDEAGHLVNVEGKWVLRCKGRPDRALLLGGQSIRLGEQVSVLEQGGDVLPFKVASVR
jgi:hypothetical protein